MTKSTNNGILLACLVPSVSQVPASSFYYLPKLWNKISFTDALSNQLDMLALPVANINFEYLQFSLPLSLLSTILTFTQKRLTLRESFYELILLHLVGRASDLGKFYHDRLRVFFRNYFYKMSCYKNTVISFLQ